MLKLKELREHKQLTQKELSNLSGVAQSHISAIENGTKDCTVSTLCFVCKAMGVTPNDLIKEQYWV